MVKKGSNSLIHWDFFTDHKQHHVTLAVRHMPSPHTCDAILEVVSNVLAEWDIMPSKVLTDNGSNMIKAFKHVQTAQSQGDLGESDKEVHPDTANVHLTETDFDSEAENDDDLTDQTFREVTEFEVQEMEHEVLFLLKRIRTIYISKVINFVVM